MRGQQVGCLSSELDAGGGDDDEVVAYPLQVGDEVGRQHNAHPVLSHDLHKALEELPTCQGIQACHRLVQDEELGPFGDGQGEVELRPLAT
jgi:hypothetical protein